MIDEIVQKLDALTSEDIQSMEANVARVSEQIRHGEKFFNALTLALR